MTITITENTPLSETPPREVLIECANGAYGLGNNFTVNWERFYELLEMEGWDMQDLGGRMDEKIRRIVRKAVREGEVT